jgi:hypothetical protein
MVHKWITAKGVLSKDDVDNKFEVSAQWRSSTEALTRGQSDSDTWYQVRYGRVTASIIKNFQTVSLDKMDAFLDKNVFEDNKSQINSEAIRYGKENESKALDAYKMTVHDRYTVQKGGFFTHPEFGWFGASPDAYLTETDSSGEQRRCRAVEIKCPHVVVSHGMTKLSDLLENDRWSRYLEGKVIIFTLFDFGLNTCWNHVL